ncbi:MAG: hypothetical protein ACYC2O_08430 [Microthrixaceae bacterium]
MSEVPAPIDPEPAAPGRARLRLDDRVRTVITTLLIVGALVGLFFVGRAAVTGTDSTSAALPRQVERLVPASGDEVLVQAQVGLDVADGYDAYLIVNGTEIRTAEDGLIRGMGNGLIVFQPGPGKPIETLNSGQNCIVAMVWDELETVDTAEPVSWCFQAT